MEQQTPPITLKNISVLKNSQIDMSVEKMTRDMKFFSTFYIIYGVIVSLTIIGAILGIPTIIYNLKLRDSAKSYQNFIDSNDFFHLSKAFENQRKFFLFNKILLIISLVFIVLYIIFFIYMISLGMMQFPQDFA